MQLCSCHWDFWALLCSASSCPAANQAAVPWLQVLSPVQLSPSSACLGRHPGAQILPTPLLVLVQIGNLLSSMFVKNKVNHTLFPSLPRSPWFEAINIVFVRVWNCQEERQKSSTLFWGENKTEKKIKLFLYLEVRNVSVSCSIVKVKNLQEKIPVVENENHDEKQCEFKIYTCCLCKKTCCLRKRDAEEID